MATASWTLTGGTGTWSTGGDWTPDPPADGDSVVIGTTTNGSSIVVTENVTISIDSLAMAGRSGRTTTLAVTPGAILTVNAGISLGPNTDIDGTGTLIANGAISGGGSITASSGLLDISGNGSIAGNGAVLSIGTTDASMLELNLSGGISTRAISISNANQTLEVGPETLTITTEEVITNGTLLMTGGTLADSSGVALGGSLPGGTLSGFGTVTANLSRSGAGTADTVMATGGTLDLTGQVGSGLVLAIGSSAPADLKIDGRAATATPIAINSANQTLEIGPAGTLTIQSAESITNGTIQLDGGTLTDSSGLSIGADATLIGTGRVSGVFSGTGTVEASGGTLDLVSAVSSTSTDFSINDLVGSVLKLAGAATSGTFTFAGPVGALELADVTGGGVVRGFDGTIAGLNVGTSSTSPTNEVNIQGTVTSAFLSGNQITVLNGTTTIATLLLSSAPGAGANAFVSADSTLGGYDVFLANAAVPLPTVSWSPATEIGVEGSRIALGAITATAGAIPLSSVMVSGIPVGDKLTDGTHTFTAVGTTTSVNVLHWNDASLSITPTNDANFTLSVQAIDLGGNTSRIATEALTVDPLAPTVTSRKVSGAQGQPIALNLGIAVNSKTGDANSLNSVTLSSIPTGATLNDSAGALTVTGGTISFTAAELAAGALTDLAITLANSGTYSLGVSATEQDANGDLSAAANGTETVTVTGPTVSWSPASETGVEGGAIALGTITAAGGGHSLTSVLVSGIPVGDTLTDGTVAHTFTAAAGTTSVNVVSWNDTKLSITPINDANFSLSVQATNTLGVASTLATEAVTVDPLAPTVAPVAVSGAQGQPIALNLGIAVNSKTGDANSLNSLTLSGIPATGATLSDSAGPLTVTAGSISFTAAELAAGALSDLAITLANTGTVDLGVTATEQDSEGNLSTAVSGTETIAVTAVAPPTVSWSPAPGPGVEGSAIALGAITAAAAGINTLTSLVVSGIPDGDTLTDGTVAHTFTAAAGTTSVNVVGWNDASLSITPINDGTVTLSVQATDSLGNVSTLATEAVTVDPLAPTVAPVAVSGAQGQAITLDLGIIVNGDSGDINSLNSLTLSGIPTSGATLSDSAGPLTVTGGTIGFTAAELAAGAPSGLAITLANTGTVDLGVTATEQDSEGNLSTAVSGTETIAVTAAAPPTVSWSAAPEPGVEGSAIALGAITAAAAGINTLTSLVVSGIPVGDTLTDGTVAHSFTAAAGTTSVNVVSWNDTSLSITPINDGTVTLSVQATDSLGNVSTLATEAVTVDPLAPTVAPVAVSGAQGQAITLNLGIIVNGESGDTNSLNSLTLSGIPATGATLSDSAGPLTVTAGSISFTAAELAAGALSDLAITLANTGTVDLGVTATEQDSEGNLSTAVSGTETIAVTAAAPPTVSWSPAPGPGVEGSAIALGAITAAGISTVTSLVVSGIPDGDTLTDGTVAHTFTAAAGTTSVNVVGWNDASLSITPINDGTVTLSVQATDSLGNVSTLATEAVTVDPLAPTVAPVAVSGAQGQAITLDLGIIVNGDSGDINSLNSLTLSGIPTSGATLSDSAGPLTVTGGTIGFTAAELAAGAPSGLAITLANTGTVDLGVTATEQDSEGNLSTAVSGTETIAVTAAAPPTVSWSAAPEPGVEGSAIALGAITAAAAGINTLTSLVVSGIPVGDTLTDGTVAHSFTAAAGTTSVNVVSWNDTSLSITPINDGTVTLSVQATDSLGNVSTLATEAVTVDPLAPTVAPVAVSGAQGQAITLNLGIIVNGESGDTNSLNSLTLSGIPTSGATLSDSAGPLTVTGGTIGFTAAELAAGAPSGLAITLANTGTVDLGVTATEQDSEGNLSTAVSGTETIAVTAAAPPTVSWSAAPEPGVEGSAIALGAITAAAAGINTLTSLVVSGIPVGDTLTDGTVAHSFTAAAGTTSVNVVSWNDTSLSITPINDGTVTLSVQATDSLGNVSTLATEAVTVDPLAPTVAPVAVSGAQGQAITLNLGIIVNGESGDTNSLNSLTLSGIPATGATLSDSAGPLTVTAGSISFTAAELAAGALSDLAITLANTGTVDLGVTATEQDSEGNLSTAVSGTETIAVTAAPTVTWSAATDGVPDYSHIVMVMEENKNYDEIIGNTIDAPYINSLADGGALLSNYFAITHPSQPNYFALYSGSTWGITTFGTYAESDPTLGTILQAAGKSFIGYVEHPDASYDHNPWEDFPEGTTVEQGFSTFPSGNFTNLPTVSFVIPNTNDDMHNGTILQGDEWLQNNLGAYAQWAETNNSLLIVTWDESDDESGDSTTDTDQVPAILYGANVTPGTYDTLYNHYSTLSTILDAYGLTGPNNAANVAPIQVFNSGTAAIGVEGQAIGLGTITPTPGANPLSAVLVSGIPDGATLTDGTATHTFTAAEANASVNVLGWNYSTLSITPANDTSFALSVQATDSSGAQSAAVSQAVTVDPLAPMVTAAQVSGSPGLPIGLDLTIAANKLDGEINSLSSVTISGIPLGATLTDGTATHTFTATAGSTSVSVLGWNYSTLSITPPTGSGVFNLNVSAVELDSEGNASTTTISQVAVTVAGGLTISTSVTGPVELLPGDNPLTITNTGTVTSTGVGKDGVDGPAGTTWTIASSGTVISSVAAGISLVSSGVVTNAGSISGNTGIILYGGGSVSNASSGSIAASGAIGGGDAIGSGIYITGVPGYVTNTGAISGAAYGVAMARGGSVTNYGSITGGEDGVSIESGTGTVSNTGKIVATSDDGVGLFLGGTVTNGVGALISGHGPSGSGIYTTGSVATVTNSGSITTAGGDFAIFMHAGGSISNAAAASIEGAVSAVFIEGATGTLTNAGTVTGATAVDLEAGGGVDNQAGGTISGSSIGVFITGGSGVVTNTGSISGTTGAAVDLAAGGSMTNSLGGSVSGGSNGVVFANKNVGTLTNSGTISASLVGSSGVYLTFGGTVTNTAGGLISGNGDGVFASSSSASVANSGSISGDHGVELAAGGSLSNAASGSITGQVAGLFTEGAAATLANYGSISATASGGAAADIEAGGSVANYAGASISGTSFGLFVTGGAGTVVNAGSISASSNVGIRLTNGGSVSNAAGASVSGAGYGVYTYGAGTVTNAGTISGTPDAVKFSGAGNDRVVVDPGAVFNGAVVGGSGNNTLELAAGTGSISLAAGLFTNFGTVEADSGSNWTLTNDNTASPDAFQLDNTSTFDVAAALGSNAQISFVSGSSDLGIANFANFGTDVGTTSYIGPLLESFVGGDMIDLKSFSATGASFAFNSDLLQLTNSDEQVATLSFQGSSLGSGTFQVATDHATGVLVTLS